MLEWIGGRHPGHDLAVGFRSAQALRAFAGGTVAGMAITYFAPAAPLFSGDRIAAVLGTAAWPIGAMLFLPSVREYGAPLWTVFCLPGSRRFIRSPLSNPPCAIGAGAAACGKAGCRT